MTPLGQVIILSRIRDKDYVNKIKWNILNNLYVNG